MKRIQRLNSQLLRTTRRSCFGLTSVLLCMATGIFALPVQAQECEPHWSDEFPTGEISIIHSTTTFDDGSGTGPAIYVGGHFEASGGPTLNNVAKLMPNNTWAPLGDGTNDHVFAFATFDDGLGDGESLYVAGYFNIAGGVDANSIARWDGNEWSPLGEGANAPITVLAVFDDGSGKGPMLYAAGGFTEAGGTKANRIARWNGSTWSALGEGVDGSIKFMAVYDDGLGDGPSLYIGGSFEQAGGISANKIAKWDGNSWSNLGEGTDGTVRSLSVFDDGSGAALYVGGSFISAGAKEALYIAKWDGLQWTSVGGGMDNFIWSLATFDDGLGDGPALYATGNFFNAGGNYAERLAKWDGVEWTEAAGGIADFHFELKVFDNPNGRSALVFAGHYNGPSELLPSSSGFAKWDGENWSTAGRGVIGQIIEEAIVVFNVVDSDSDSNFEPGLYVGGLFNAVEDLWSPKVARWDKGKWSTVGGGIPSDWGWVYDMDFFDDGLGDGPALYAGGIWGNYNSKPTIQFLSKFDGKEWSPLNVDVDDSVRSMIVFDDGMGYGDRLYVAGNFQHAGEQLVSRIAAWDGIDWMPLAGGGMDYRINALFAYDDGSGAGTALYAGGSFTMAGNTEANRIAKWDGTQWLPLGQGMDDSVYALSAYDDGSGLALYVGGHFKTAGGKPAAGVAKWQNNSWSPLAGGGIDGLGYTSVRAFQVYDDKISERPALYISGSFSSVGNIPAQAIARWDGQDWMSLDQGLHIGKPDYDFEVRGFTMAPFDDGTGDGEALFVGGDFTFAGNSSSQRIAKWIVCENSIPGDLDGDGVVTKSDLTILLSNWGPCDDCNNCPADINNDCSVSTSDLLILFSNWG